MEEWGAGKRGRECESETFILFNLNVASSANVSKTSFHLYALYEYNSKDLFDKPHVASVDVKEHGRKFHRSGSAEAVFCDVEKRKQQQQQQ